MSEFRVSDRVYYRDNGPEDTGTVVKIDEDGIWVEFDRDKAYFEVSAYEPEHLAPALRRP